MDHGHAGQRAKVARDRERAVAVVNQELLEVCDGRARVAEAEGAGEGEGERRGRGEEDEGQNRGEGAEAHRGSLKHEHWRVQGKVMYSQSASEVLAEVPRLPYLTPTANLSV